MCVEGSGGFEAGSPGGHGAAPRLGKNVLCRWLARPLCLGPSPRTPPYLRVTHAESLSNAPRAALFPPRECLMGPARPPKCN